MENQFVGAYEVIARDVSIEGVWFRRGAVLTVNAWLPQLRRLQEAGLVRRIQNPPNLDLTFAPADFRVSFL